MDKGAAAGSRVDEYVAISEVAVAQSGAQDLERAFADRVRLVEQAEGFREIEVLRDRRRPGRYLMVSRWSDKQAFTRYMHSTEHAFSHARIRTGPGGPRPAGFSDYDRVEV
ncbi:MAG: hypothetical protein NVSMB17_09390 [Candidatus Dormibacteria bacterium]